MILYGVDSVVIEQSRWDVKITIRFRNGKYRTFVASADSYYTDRNGIWWGTEEEYKEWESQ